MRGGSGRGSLTIRDSPEQGLLNEGREESVLMDSGGVFPLR